MKTEFVGNLTNGGSILVTKYPVVGFTTPTGEWIRECSNEEAAYLLKQDMPVVFMSEAKAADFRSRLPELPPQWTLVGSIRTLDDYSSYKPETSCNGGNYSFHERTYFFVGQVGKKKIILTTGLCETSAEFGYDEMTGNFEQNLPYAECLNTVEDFHISSKEVEEDFFLEEISGKISFYDVQLTGYRYIPSPEDTEDDIEAAKARFRENLEEIVYELKARGFGK